MMRRLTAALLSGLLVVLALTGCSGDNVSSPGEQSAPELPPTSTMAMNITLFESTDVDQEVLAAEGYEGVHLAAGMESRLNFLNAAIRVHFLNLVVCVSLIEPVAAFGLAVRSFPQPQPDGSWLWTYLYVGPSAEYSVFLNGKDMGDYTQWAMEVSSTDPSEPLDHFLWFEGQVDRDGNSGYWQFFEPEDAPPALMSATAGSALATPGVECIRIDWEHYGQDEHELAFLINKAGAPEEGTSLTYFDSPSESSVEFYNAETGDTGTIWWYPDGSGSIEWPDYRDGGKYCWDTLQ